MYCVIFLPQKNDMVIFIIKEPVMKRTKDLFEEAKWREYHNLSHEERDELDFQKQYEEWFLWSYRELDVPDSKFVNENDDTIDQLPF